MGRNRKILPASCLLAGTLLFSGCSLAIAYKSTTGNAASPDTRLNADAPGAIADHGKTTTQP